MLSIKVKYIIPDLMPLQVQARSDWIDMRSAVTVAYSAGEALKIPLGVAIRLPQGYEAHIVARSSSFDSHGFILTNAMGIIDNSFCGNEDEWHLPILAVRDGKIHKNDRICQFRIVPQMCCEVEKVKSLSAENRGGLGSTGKNEYL